MMAATDYAVRCYSWLATFPYVIKHLGYFEASMVSFKHLGRYRDYC